MYHLSRKVVDMHRCDSTWVAKDKSSIATCKKKQLISALIGVSLCKGVLRMLNSRGPHVGMLLGEISLNIDQWEERGSAKDFSWGNSLTLEKKGLLIYSKIIFLFTTSQDVLFCQIHWKITMWYLLHAELPKNNFCIYYCNWQLLLAPFKLEVWSFYFLFSIPFLLVLYMISFFALVYSKLFTHLTFLCTFFN